MRLLALAVLALGVWLVAPARAETFRLEAPDGTIHLTNTPTDPAYRRMGIAPPTPARPASWLSAPVSQGARFMNEIREAAQRYGIPEQLIAAVIRVESGFNPRAVSRKGALGLMQLMPSTAALLGVRDAFDPRQNIDGGTRHLRNLIDRFGNDLHLALAAYNAGEQAVLTYNGIPPYPETQDYVMRVLRYLNGDAGRVSSARIPTSTYRRLERDGTLVYTNIPPRGRL